MWGQSVLSLSLLCLAFSAVQLVNSYGFDGYSWVSNKDHEDVQEAFEFFTKCRVLDRHRPKSFHFATKPLLGFEFHNCGGDNDPFRINGLNVVPDPIHIPGPADITFSVSSEANINAPVKVQLHLMKKIGLWVPIPCINNVGSCTYDDICPMLPAGPCPAPFQEYNIPCHCPFPAGVYEAANPGIAVEIPNIGLPPILTDGDFWVQAKVYSGNQHLACYEIYFSLTH